MRKVLVIVFFLSSFFCAHSQWRGIMINNSSTTNIIGISFITPSTGFVAFNKFIGYTTDSGYTYTQYPITTSNVNYNGYTVGLTIGFTPKGVKALTQDSLFVYGHYGYEPSILFSTDRGATWKLVYHKNVNLSATLFNQGVTDFKMFGNVMYAVHHEEVIKSTNRGQSWSVALSSPLAELKRLSFISITTGYVIGGLKLYKTTTSGVSWINQSSTLKINTGYEDYNNVFFTSLTNGYITERKSGKVFRNTGSSAWTLMNDTLYNNVSGGNIYFKNDSTGFIDLMYTNNYGKNWEICKTIVAAGSFQTINALHFYNNNIAWAGGDRANLWITTNGGSVTHPKAAFTIDASNVSTTTGIGTVYLNNLSKANYTYKWIVNGTQISTSYNAYYTHNPTVLTDYIQLIVSNGVNADTLLQAQQYPNLYPLKLKSFKAKYTGRTWYAKIIGENFSLATISKVTLGGIPARDYFIQNDTTLLAFPDTAGASGKIIVHSDIGNDSLIGFKFCHDVAIKITQNTPDYVCYGTQVIYKVFATCKDSFTTKNLQWTVNYSNTAVGDSFVSTTILNGDQIRCTVTGTTTCTSGINATSDYLEQDNLPTKPEIFFTQNPFGNICTNQAVSFTPTIKYGGDKPKFVWKKNSLIVDTNRIYTTSTLNNNDTITCTITSSLTCLATKTLQSDKLIVKVGAGTRYYTYLPLIEDVLQYKKESLYICDVGQPINRAKIPLVYGVSNMCMDTIARRILLMAGSTLEVIDMNTNAILLTKNLAAGSSKVMACAKQNKIYIANLDSSRIDVLDYSTFTLQKSINLSGVVTTFILSNNQSKLFVSHSNGMCVINTNSDSVVQNNPDINHRLRYAKFKRMSLNDSTIFAAPNLIINANNLNYFELNIPQTVDSLIWDIAISNDAKTIVAAMIKTHLPVYVPNSLIFYDIATNTIKKEVKLLSSSFIYSTSIYNLSFTPDDKFVYMMSNGNSANGRIESYNIIKDSFDIFGLYNYPIPEFITPFNYFNGVYKSECNDSLNIAGRIITPQKKVIKNALINTTGDKAISISSNQLGEYATKITPGNYTIHTTKNNDITKANGLNATDVLFVQRHILNTSKLNSAYKLIAADVNGDKLVNATDLLRIKRLILGTDTTFTKGSGVNKVDRLWEFVDSAYTFPDTTNPFPFKDSISFTNLTSNKINQTFIGVKLGDVNYDWNPAVARQSTVNSIQLTANVDLKTINGELRIPITVNNFKDILAMQYTLHFNNKDYEFVDIENNKLDIDFNSKQANQNGNISFLWTDKNAVEKSLEDGRELFTLVLRSTVDGRLSTDLTLTSDITEVAAWDKDYNQHSIILNKRETKNEQPETRNEVIIYPNPTKGLVNLYVEALVGKGNIVIADVYGKLVKTQPLNLGTNTIDIAKLSKGIYFVSIITNEGKTTKKLVVE